MTYCDTCLHKNVCGLEGANDEAMIFCSDKMERISTCNRMELEELLGCPLSAEYYQAIMKVLEIIDDQGIELVHYCWYPILRDKYGKT